MRHAQGWTVSLVPAEPLLARAHAVFPDEPRPRILPFLGALVVLLAIVVYGVPIVTTGDPLWPLPTDTKAQTLAVYWDGRHSEVARGASSYDALMDAVNAALSSPQGIEYRYGLTADAFTGARGTGRAVEALYTSPQRAHGAYALGEFTRLFVFLAGEEYERGLIFVGDQSGYRSGPMRARDLSVLRDLASSARTEAPPPSPRARGYHLPAPLDGGGTHE